MKVIMRNISIGVISVVVVLGSFMCWFRYETEYKITTISEYTSPNNKYTIRFQSVGEPFLFGPDEVKITLLDYTKKKIQTISESISNDGAKACEGNIKVKWFDEYVEIILSGEQQQDETYKIDYIGNLKVG